MDEYIKKEEAIAKLDSLDYSPGEFVVRGLTMCKEAIQSIQAVSIVHCKDCKYYKPMKCCPQQMICHAGALGFDRGPDFFCAFGERMCE